MHEDWNRDFKTKYEFKDAISRGCDLCLNGKVLNTEYFLRKTSNG